MTTLVGIKTGNGDEGVVLGSDMSRTQTGWNPQGDVAYRVQRRIEGQKIYVNDTRDLALCMSGVFDNQYIDFLSAVLEGNIDFRQAIEQEHFAELEKLNLARWGGRVPNSELVNGLLIATRYDEPRLYTCWPLGSIEEKSAYASIGSGSDYALKHIGESGKLIPKRVNVNEGIDLVVESLDQASQDLYTGGLDLVVVKREGIFDLGEGIRGEVNKARHSAIEKAKQDLSQNL